MSNCNVELLGEDGAIVFRDYGYNRRAEVLREENMIREEDVSRHRG